MFTISDNKFDRYLELKQRVSNDVVTDDYIKYFDNDGFELSFLEQEYYRENKVGMNKILNHICDQREWISCKHDKLKVDHSMILQRWEFVQHARMQLEDKKTTFPQLNKYLRLKAKWGLDFALEYYDGDEALEVLHIETDYSNYYEAVGAKQIFEKKIQSTDWNDFVKSLIKNKLQWEGLQGMEQNDWKARHWGLNKAEKTLKAFS